MFGKTIRKQERPFVSTVIPAAGTSSRMQGINKLLYELGGLPVLIRTLMQFEASDEIDEIIVVCKESEIIPYGKLIAAYPLRKVQQIVAGGDVRATSVLKGLCAVSQQAEFVAVHDAARPLVTEQVIRDAVRAAIQCDAAAPCVPLKESVKRVEGGIIRADVPRDHIMIVQTPQVFRTELLRRALESGIESGFILTDDCAAVEYFGATVQATEGSYENIKITTPEDLVVAKALLRRRNQK